jgi:hypothetical protein
MGLFYHNQVTDANQRAAFSNPTQLDPYADGLGVPDVQIAVRLRWKPGMHSPAEPVGPQVFLDGIADEVICLSLAPAHNPPLPLYEWGRQTQFISFESLWIRTGSTQDLLKVIDDCCYVRSYQLYFKS